MSCKLTEGVSLECDEAILPGVRDRLILINFDDFKAGTLTMDLTNDVLATNLTLPVGVNAYAFIGEGIEPNENLAGDEFQRLYRHETRFRIFKDDPATKQTVLKLTRGKVVAIVETNNDRFEIFGKDSGLICTEYANNRADAAEVGYNLLLSTRERDREKLLPLTLFDTDYLTTKGIVESLLAA